MTLLELLAVVETKLPADGIVTKVELNAVTIGAILTAAFTVIGGLATLFLLVGAVRYVTSNGDQGQMAQAKNTILYAIVGIVVSLSAFAIVQFVVGQLS